MDYIQKFIKFRKEKNISQSKLAEILNTNQQQISKYEKKLQELPLRHIIKLSEEFKTTPNKILGYEENLKVEDEKKIISEWNKLSERNKGKVELIIEQLIDEQAKEREII